MRFHVAAEHGIDAGLVALALLFEPGQNVRVHPRAGQRWFEILEDMVSPLTRLATLADLSRRERGLWFVPAMGMRDTCRITL